MEQTTELSTVELKNRALTNNAVELITTNPHLSNQQIAESLGIGRTTLWNLLKGEYAQELLRRELHEAETGVWQSIYNLENTTPPNPSNTRFAAKLRYDIAKNIADKVRPTKTETLNVNINIDLDKLQQFQQDIYQAVNTLPPTMRTQLWQAYNNITQQRNKTHTVQSTS